MSDDSRNFPLVTVGTLCYNTGKYVVEALESVKRQNYPNIQHIIIDDVSKDNSVELVEQWIKDNNYECTFIKHKTNRGVQYNVKEMLDLSKGKYLAFISDDLWTDDKLLEQVALLESLDDSYALVYGDANMIDKDGKVLVESMFEYYRGKGFIPPSGDIFREVVKDFYFFTQAALMSLEHFKRMNSSFSKEIISEDWDWQLWASRNYNCVGVNKVYCGYRWLETSIGRTTWTDEKFHLVLVSHIKMMLNYYSHPKNTSEDKRIIFDRVMLMYNTLTNTRNAVKKQKLKALFQILATTRNLRLLPVIGSLYFFSKEAFAKRIMRLT